jgi:hypothetical protein
MRKLIAVTTPFLQFMGARNGFQQALSLFIVMKFRMTTTVTAPSQRELTEKTHVKRLNPSRPSADLRGFMSELNLQDLFANGF